MYNRVPNPLADAAARNRTVVSRNTTMTLNDRLEAMNDEHVANLIEKMDHKTFTKVDK